MSDDVKNNSSLKINFRNVMLRPDLGAIVGVVLVLGNRVYGMYNKYLY